MVMVVLGSNLMVISMHQCSRADGTLMSASYSGKCCQSRKCTLDAISGASKEPKISKLVPLTRTASKLGQKNRGEGGYFLLAPNSEPVHFLRMSLRKQALPFENAYNNHLPSKSWSQFDTMPTCSLFYFLLPNHNQESTSHSLLSFFPPTFHSYIAQPKVVGLIEYRYPILFRGCYLYHVVAIELLTRIFTTGIGQGAGGRHGATGYLFMQN